MKEPIKINKENYQRIFEFSLVADNHEFEERYYDTIADKDIRLALRENRIALAKGEIITIPSLGEPNVNFYDLPLICVFHSHPECRFRWARLMIDFGATKDTRIQDMSPKEIMGRYPIEQTTTIGGNLKYDIVPKILRSELNAEKAKKNIIYYPEIISSGIGFTKCYWDFLAKGDEDYMHSNRELRILISSSSDLPLTVRFNLRAKIKLAGTAGLIPLIAKSSEIDRVFNIP